MNARRARLLLGLRWADLQDLKQPGGRVQVVARLRRRYQRFSLLALPLGGLLLATPHGLGRALMACALFLAFNAFRWWEAENLLAIAVPGPGPSRSPTDPCEP